MNTAEAREATLREAVERLYAVFRRYRLPAEIDPDPCFPSVCNDLPLRAAPLRELPASAFVMYASKAITTWGTVDDFKHFLPRLFDLVAKPSEDGRGLEFDSFLAFSKIEYGRWRRWPVDEREALADYCPALWRAVLTRPYFFSCSAGFWLKDFSEIYDDLSPFLTAWEADAQSDVAAPWPARHLAETIIDFHESMSKKGSLNWWRKSAQEQLLIRWLSSDAIATILETAFFRVGDDSHAERLSLAVEMHTWWRSRAAGEK